MKLQFFIVFSIFLLLFSFQISSAQTSTAPLLSKTYRGSFSSTTQYNESLTAPSNQLMDYYKLTIKNGDGIVFAPKTCSGNFIQKLACSLLNTINSLLSSSNKVDWAKILINNVEVVNSTQINKTKLAYDTVLKLNSSNQLNITIKGSILSYIQVELKYLGEAVDQTPPIIASNVASGALTQNNLVHISITDKSSVSNEVYKDNVLLETNSSKEFDLTLTEGTNNFTIKSKDSLNNVAPDFVLSNIILDTTPPALISDIKDKYTVDNLPGNIIIHFTSNEELTSAEIDGLNVTLDTPQTFTISKNITDPGSYAFTIKVKDKFGNELIKSFNFSVEETFSLTILSPIKDEVLQTDLVNISVKSNKLLDDFYINGKQIGLSSDKTTVSKQLRVPLHGSYSIQIRGISGTLEKTKNVTFQLGKNTIEPWKYEECPAQ